MEPLFSLEKEDAWRAAHPSLRTVGLRLGALGGGVAVLVTGSDQVVRWDTDAGRVPEGSEASELVEFPRGSRAEGSRIHSLFVDPSGSHLLVCVVSSGVGQTYYCCRGGAGGARPVLKELIGLKGHVLECCVWAPLSGTAEAMGPFLAGTAAGRALLGRVSSEKRVLEQLDVVWDGGSDGGVGCSGPITVLRWERVGSASTGGARPLILLATRSPARLLQFLGQPSTGRGDAFAGAKEAFAACKGRPAPMLELSLGESGAVCAEAALCYAEEGLGGARSGSSSSPPLTPEGIALLSSSGYALAAFGDAAEVARSGGAPLDECVFAPFPAREGAGGGGIGRGGGEGGDAPRPQCLALTPFHTLLLYKNKVLALSRIPTPARTFSITWEAPLPEARYGTMRALLRDATLPPTSCLHPYDPPPLPAALVLQARQLLRSLPSPPPFQPLP